ncbi:hypothetical protein PPACK8108_LOCUS9651, partial [Phakopsora pachyrhizi]
IQEEREKIIRDDWVRVMKHKINREKLSECYKTEGVNSYEQCAKLAQTVLDQIPDGRVK